VRRAIERIGKIGKAVEDGLLVGLLATMIIVAGAQIVSRNLLDRGFVWGDELLRILVVWLTFVGAVAASRDRNHVAIDLLSRFLPRRGRLAARLLADVATAAIAALLAYASIRFVGMEKEAASTVLQQIPTWISRFVSGSGGEIGVPAWLVESILPVGFGLVAWRYLVLVFADGAELFGKEAAPE